MRIAPTRRSSNNLKLAAAWRVRGRVFRATGDQLMAAGNREQARAVYVQALNDLHARPATIPATGR